MARVRVITGVVAALAILLVTSGLRAQDGRYFPAAGDKKWERRQPAEAGFDGAALAAAIQFAKESESKEPRDLALKIALSYANEPYNDILGPTQPRGELSGVILRRGYLVAEWGEPGRVDMTFSVTKSFLSTVVGLAYERGLIRDLNDRAGEYVPGDLFASEHNAKITWDHLLRQTSGWDGTLWDKPAWADRPEGKDVWEWPKKKPDAPGARWKYNDVRVNVLALAALHVWREPLPEVLREEVMDPIGASHTWHWEGYRNSWVEMEGQKVQSMSGGGHWGGGMFINAYDMARFGYLCLNKGRWMDRQIFSEKWFALATTPTPQNEGYGFMNWFLRKEEAPGGGVRYAIKHLGNGTNLIYVDPARDLVAVVRWIESKQVDPFIDKLIAAVRE